MSARAEACPAAAFYSTVTVWKALLRVRNQFEDAGAGVGQNGTNIATLDYGWTQGDAAIALYPTHDLRWHRNVNSRAVQQHQMVSSARIRFKWSRGASRQRRP